VPLSSVGAAVEAFARGDFVIVIDDESRENEGDLCLAAAAATAERVNFMMRWGRGLICVAMEPARLDQLRLPPMVAENTSLHHTGFAVSVDAAAGGVTTGISAADRAVTIRSLADPRAVAEDFLRPGHVFPLRAMPGGVLERRGHTEAAVDLARLAGLEPAAGVVCEIASEDGDMARPPELERFAREQGIPIVRIRDLVEHRRASSGWLEQGPPTRLPIAGREWQAIAFADRAAGLVHLALRLGEPPLPEPVLVRVHSECLTGDVFGSQRCDCQAQLHAAMDEIAVAGSGLVVYLRQEGRGIGLMDKLRAYALQDAGLDTVEANLELGLPADGRDYTVGRQIMSALGVRRIRLLSNNPHKQAALAGAGLEVEARVPLEIPPNPHNYRYLRTKREKMGHLLSVPGVEESRCAR
jgi:3,4-dihydroxy 2-butanone 4-phosphate synthase/GTP cyclohydrolase II